jgi:hypothetical protein
VSGAGVVVTVTVIALVVVTAPKSSVARACTVCVPDVIASQVVS